MPEASDRRGQTWRGRSSPSDTCERVPVSGLSGAGDSYGSYLHLELSADVTINGHIRIYVHEPVARLRDVREYACEHVTREPIQHRRRHRGDPDSWDDST